MRARRPHISDPRSRPPLGHPRKLWRREYTISPLLSPIYRLELFSLDRTLCSPLPRGREVGPTHAHPPRLHAPHAPLARPTRRNHQDSPARRSSARCAGVILLLYAGTRKLCTVDLDLVLLAHLVLGQELGRLTPPVTLQLQHFAPVLVLQNGPVGRKLLQGGQKDQRGARACELRMRWEGRRAISLRAMGARTNLLHELEDLEEVQVGGEPGDGGQGLPPAALLVANVNDGLHHLAEDLRVVVVPDIERVCGGSEGAERSGGSVRQARTRELKGAGTRSNQAATGSHGSEPTRRSIMKTGGRCDSGTYQSLCVLPRDRSDCSFSKCEFEAPNLRSAARGCRQGRQWGELAARIECLSTGGVERVTSPGNP